MPRIIEPRDAATRIAGGEFLFIRCYRCQVPYGLPYDLYVSARRDERISFYCPHGHGGHYPAGKTTEDELREQLDAMRGDVAHWRNEYANERTSHSSTKGQLTKTLNRAKAGMCPHCRRTFANYARHMKRQHAEE